MIDAVRFWEPRRVVYNAVLAVSVLIWLAWSWPHFEPATTWGNLGRLAVLAVIANLCYSTAYLVEVAMGSGCRENDWLVGRKIVFVAGLLLAVIVENYWIADEIYPFVR